jgi:hypothetical protein
MNVLHRLSSYLIAVDVNEQKIEFEVFFYKSSNRYCYRIKRLDLYNLQPLVQGLDFATAELATKDDMLSDDQLWFESEKAAKKYLQSRFEYVFGEKPNLVFDPEA